MTVRIPIRRKAINQTVKDSLILGILVAVTIYFVGWCAYQRGLDSCDCPKVASLERVMEDR
jgi:hypothetical protein